MSCSRSILGLLVCACASAHGEEIEAPGARAAAASGVEIVPDAEIGDPVEPAPATCPIEIPPAPRAVAPPSEPATGRCTKPSRATARTLERDVRARWQFADDDANLNVEFECDRLAPKIRELVVESSSGHGFTLQLDRVRPRKDGDYDLLRLEYGAQGNPYDLVTPDEWHRMAVEGATVRVGVLPRARFEAALRRMRAALHLRIEEQLPASEGFGSVSMSSRDFHVAYRLVDSEGRGAQGFWAGYEGSEDQASWLPLDLAAEAYGVVAWADDVERSLAARKPVDGDRDFFVQRFVAARDRNAEYGFWYVRERLLAMARDLGDARIASDLLDIARTSGEHEVARSQAAAVDVLVRITGYDPRYERGEPRAPVDAAADMVRVCG